MTWAKTEVVITDKDMAEWCVFSTAFPTLPHSPYDVEGSHHQEDGSTEWAVQSGQSDTPLVIFSAIACADIEAVFYEQCTLLQRDVVAQSSASTARCVERSERRAFHPGFERGAIKCFVTFLRAFSRFS